MSVDGKIATHPFESTAERNKNNFTCPDDFAHMQKLVSSCDVVFLGAKSIEVEQGAFRVGHLRADGNEPEWIIFTRSGNITFQSHFWKQKNIPKSLFFVSSFDKLEIPQFYSEIKEFPFGEINCYLGNINGLIEYLKAKNVNKAALLGGGKLNTPFWENHFIEELHLTISPFLVGHKDAPTILSSEISINTELILKKTLSRNNFVYLTYQTKPTRVK